MPIKNKLPKKSWKVGTGTENGVEGGSELWFKNRGHGGGLSYAERVLGARNTYVIIDWSNALFFALNIRIKSCKVCWGSWKSCPIISNSSGEDTK
jgi:uncharacterized membrane protein